LITGSSIDEETVSKVCDGTSIAPYPKYAKWSLQSVLNECSQTQMDAIFKAEDRIRSIELTRREKSWQTIEKKIRVVNRVVVNRLRAVKVIRAVGRRPAAAKANSGDSKVANRVANQPAVNKAVNRIADCTFSRRGEFGLEQSSSLRHTLNF
jgi:hypothetical protein